MRRKPYRPAYTPPAVAPQPLQRNIYYCRCGGEINVQRFKQALLDKVAPRCLLCGEREAQLEITAKGKRIAPDGNKQGYSYQGDAATAKKNIEQAGKKYASVNSASDAAYQFYTPRESHSSVPQKRRKIGLFWVGRDCYTWYEGVNPAHHRATRQIRW